MNDHFDDVVFYIRDAAKQVNDSVTVAEDSSSIATKFPFIGVLETNSTPASLDSDLREKYTNMRFRVRFCSNKETGRRLEAAKLFRAVDAHLTAANFTRLSKTSKPELYQSTVYEITATYEVVFDETGRTYRR